MAACRDADPALAALDLRLHGTVRAAVHLPDIVHASFARVVQAAPPTHAGPGNDGGCGSGGYSTGTSDIGSSGRGSDDDLAALFAEVAAVFVPFWVPVTALTLANEVSPYMHQRRAEGTVKTFLLTANLIPNESSAA